MMMITVRFDYMGEDECPDHEPFLAKLRELAKEHDLKVRGWGPDSAMARFYHMYFNEKGEMKL